MKNCIRCGIQLTPDNTKPYRIKNYIHKCDECDRKEKKEHARKSRNEDPKSTRERSRRHSEKVKKSNPVKYSCSQMSASSKKRAEAYGWDRDIDTEYLISIAPTHCPILGLKLKYGGGEKQKNSCSLDRINSSLGYTRGNVQIISNLANLMKSNASPYEMIMFSEWVMRTFEKMKRVSREK